MRYEEELFQNLQKQKEKLIITVIHNLRAAIRYCTRLILLSEGKIIKDGKPEEVITEELLKQVYEIEARIYRNPITGALEDRKSTRLNSSHANISYAVFCLKKK